MSQAGAQGGRIFELRITLVGSKPPIWRKVAVPADFTLGQLHEVIQAVMGWDNSHLHAFMLQEKGRKNSLGDLADFARSLAFNALSRGTRNFGPTSSPMGDDLGMDGEDEDQVTLAEACANPKAKLTYEYDFGDSWQHRIELKKIVDPQPEVRYPVCLEGKMASPREDCGGLWGHYDMLAALADPEHHLHEEYCDWLGEDYDPEAFDLQQANKKLEFLRPQKKGQVKGKKTT